MIAGERACEWVVGTRIEGRPRLMLEEMRCSSTDMLGVSGGRPVAYGASCRTVGCAGLELGDGAIGFPQWASRTRRFRCGREVIPAWKFGARDGRSEVGVCQVPGLRCYLVVRISPGLACLRVGYYSRITISCLRL